jgi:hypothetical protein
VNEQQLVDRLARTAETLPDPAQTSLARIQSRAHARRRRRQLLEVAAVMPVEVGPVRVTIHGPEQRTIVGLFTPTSDEGVWQLMQLGDGPDVQQSEPWSVIIRPPNAAGSADLFVRYEGQTWHLPLGGEQLEQQARLAHHGLPEGGQIDSALIVYRDTAGTTLDADGGHY